MKVVSMLLNIPNFSITNGVVPDYMHGILLGVVKTLVFLVSNCRTSSIIPRV